MLLVRASTFGLTANNDYDYLVRRDHAMKIISAGIVSMVLLFTNGPSVFAQEYQIVRQGAIPAGSYRGLSVVDNRIAWMSGNNGLVGRTLDGGSTWDIRTAPGFEKADFRSLYAFDDVRAVIANAGSPGYILVTEDGGQHWTTVYSNSHAEVFFDGIDFWNDRDGLIYGDPIDGKMLMLRTADGGKTWTAVQTAPPLEKGEASFAASGTGIRCYGKRGVMICTGGIVSRLWKSGDRGNNWESIRPPIAQGQATSGIYSFALKGKQITVVGGDYSKEGVAANNHLYSTDEGQSWQTPQPAIRGYRECVEFITGNMLVAAGPAGADISRDHGISWSMLSDQRGIHVLRKARKGKLVIMAGNTETTFTLRMP